MYIYIYIYVSLKSNLKKITYEDIRCERENEYRVSPRLLKPNRLHRYDSCVLRDREWESVSCVFIRATARANVRDLFQYRYAGQIGHG